MGEWELLVVTDDASLPHVMFVSVLGVAVLVIDKCGCVPLNTKISKSTYFTCIYIEGRVLIVR